MLSEQFPHQAQVASMQRQQLQQRQQQPQPQRANRSPAGGVKARASVILAGQAMTKHLGSGAFSAKTVRCAAAWGTSLTPRVGGTPS
mmetsp:Transcript_54596/g.151465  ORF Transcript_54596/g.151465 Transcript_54596/m.151465 type:complete len:87 (+) Transcript_54596:622-882(+)